MGSGAAGPPAASPETSMRPSLTLQLRGSMKLLPCLAGAAADPEGRALEAAFAASATSQPWEDPHARPNRRPTRARPKARQTPHMVAEVNDQLRTGCLLFMPAGDRSGDAT